MRSGRSKSRFARASTLAKSSTAGDKASGIAVNVAARIAALAEPSEILVSQTVKDLVAGSGLRFDDRGSSELKGVEGAWHLYAVAASRRREP